MDPEISVGIAVDFVKGLVVIGRKNLRHRGKSDKGQVHIGRTWRARAVVRPEDSHMAEFPASEIY